MDDRETPDCRNITFFSKNSMNFLCIFSKSTLSKNPPRKPILKIPRNWCYWSNRCIKKEKTHEHILLIKSCSRSTVENRVIVQFSDVYKHRPKTGWWPRTGGFTLFRFCMHWLNARVVLLKSSCKLMVNFILYGIYYNTLCTCPTNVEFRNQLEKHPANVKA